ncbi:MAG TPA: NADP-dependent oxidoreductase [Blastocatellia bacterium]|nr:NADP-dependent oxidoreductase [Blastocatellia bacterium]
MTSGSNRQWRLVARPEDKFKRTDFEWREEPIPTPGDGQLLVRNLYLSLDPTNRIWAARDSYLPAVKLGDVMRGISIGVVEQSRNPSFREGVHVQGLFGWQDYAVTDGTGVTPLPDDPSTPLTAYFGVLGHIGFTAYFGLLDIGKPEVGETLVVSAAAGATGSLVGQIGKIKGCRVIGIAGADDKCKWLTDELGFDAAVNYKSGPILDSLKAVCPNGIDVYFDNVGGEILDAALDLINLRARIVLCGLISQYNSKEPQPGPYNFGNILTRRGRVEGFIVLDYAKRFPEALPELRRWMADGRLKYRVDVVEDLENAPEAINRLFDGSNIGKLVVRV